MSVAVSWKLYFHRCGGKKIVAYCFLPALHTDLQVPSFRPSPLILCVKEYIFLVISCSRNLKVNTIVSSSITKKNIVTDYVCLSFVKKNNLIRICGNRS